MDQRNNGDENDAGHERNRNGNNKHHLNISKNNNNGTADARRRRRSGDHHSGEDNAQSFITKSSEDGTSGLNTSAILTPQMIQDQRIKAMEHEMREMAKQQRQKQQQLRNLTSVGEPPPDSSANVGVAMNNNNHTSNEHHNGEGRTNNGRAYPSQMDKYWDKQFGRASAKSIENDNSKSTNNFASQSSGLISMDNNNNNNDEVPPLENTALATANGDPTVSMLKKMKDHHTSNNLVPVAPGAYAQVGPGAANNRTAQLDEDNGDNQGVERTTESNLIQASKVDDAQTIVDATDVQQDNFKRRLIVGSILLFAVALALGLYFGLSSNQKPKECSDDFCCDQSKVPIGHLAPVSCYCFGTTELIHGDDDHDHDHGHAAFSQDYFDQTKKYFMEFLQSAEEEMTSSSNNSSFVNTAIQELEPMQGKTCHPYDQMLLMFSNNVTFESYLSQKRAKVRDSHLMLASLFVATNGVNWTVNTGWFDAMPDDDDDDDEEEGDFGDVTFGICTWFGLECLFSNHVSFMNLRENNLNGTLPSELFMFSRLQQLDVAVNYDLTGELPAALGNLVELTSLSISATGLYGTIPSELANISELHELDLGGDEDPCSGFRGEIPPALFDNPFLRSVFIVLNDLQTTLPPEVGNATNLQTLSLLASRLTGQIPIEIANLTSLKILDLSYNLFDSDATIPSEILLNLPDLEFLNLAYSGLDETIPESFCENANATGTKLLVGASCDYPICSCCHNATDSLSSSTGDILVDIFCVQSNDAWGTDLAFCTDDELDD